MHDIKQMLFESLIRARPASRTSTKIKLIEAGGSAPETSNISLTRRGLISFTKKFTCLGSASSFLIGNSEGTTDRIRKVLKVMRALNFV